MKILIADRSKAYCDTVQHMLEDEGHEVIGFRTGEELLALLDKISDCRIVITAAVLNGAMNGMDVLTAIKADPRHQNVRVIMCTASSSERLPKVVAEAGGIFIPKGIDLIQRFAHEIADLEKMAA